jgi:type VI secretion system protein ImpA
MTLDLEKLLAPVPGDDPAGPDLAYDPQRHEIEQAFETSVSIDASGIAETGDVDWRAIIATIAALSERTKDIWLPVYLCRAGAQAGQLGTVALGARALAGLLETYWTELHPRLEDYGVQGRKAACDTLAAHREFIGPLGRVVLVDHGRLGHFTAADLVRFHRGGEAEEGYGLFRAALADGAEAQLGEAGVALDAVSEALRRVDETLTAHADAGNGTNFADTYDSLGAIRTAVAAFLPQAPLDLDEVEDEAAEGEGAAPAAAGVGAVRNRADVVRTLDLVIDYYRRSEPTSPVPLLLERAKSWVMGDFMAVLQDIVPGALDEARLLLQSRSQGEG